MCSPASPNDAQARGARAIASTDCASKSTEYGREPWEQFRSVFQTALVSEKN